MVVVYIQYLESSIDEARDVLVGRVVVEIGRDGLSLDGHQNLGQ